MTARKMPEEVRAGLTALKEAVREELKRKAKLGQYAIVARNGKAVRVKASTLLGGRKKRQRGVSSPIL